MNTTDGTSENSLLNISAIFEKITKNIIKKAENVSIAVF